MNKLIIALDGPSGSGKGLISSMLAEKFNLHYVQSSIIYRGLAYYAIKNNISDFNELLETAKTLNIQDLKSIDLNREEIGNKASQLAVHQELRKVATNRLKGLVEIFPRLIMEGRDVGTVILPDATIKIFLTADVKVRAQRRYKQLCSEGKECILSEILELMEERDRRDLSRASAPLRPADDALIVDSSNLEPAEVVEFIEKRYGHLMA